MLQQWCKVAHCWYVAGKQNVKTMAVLRKSLYDFSFDNNKFWITTLVTCVLLIRLISIFRSSGFSGQLYLYLMWLLNLWQIWSWHVSNTIIIKLPSTPIHPHALSSLLMNSWIQKYIVCGVSEARYFYQKWLIEDQSQFPMIFWDNWKSAKNTIQKSLESIDIILREIA